MLSHDDDEATSWASDGKLAGAWIEYTLAQPSAPTQIDVKLTAFRTRRYPIRITLDGAVLYEGTTPNSLGYITIPFKQSADHPITGSHLRIALTAPAIDFTPPASTSEVTGNIDPTAVTRNSSAVLSIVEADIYR